ncbi:DNA repair protein RecO [Sphingomonas sp. HDW15A]|uniref:DNA repair protein RecO n=1 Tax=Sphingomonas sp. HDW15A TaxID=2714942 RepID=UPI00140DA16C|nr:DNA repair protein RecO [Sphingomonas sp. HDW15A]QIK95712.1 DNA repair protein RecO [Sphingomonas sp. HDW15A]
MRIETKALVVALRPHGEHGAIVRLMTPESGLQPCYVRGARGKRLRPVLVPGNLVEASIVSRTDTQLGQGTIELLHSRGPLLSEPLPAAAIDWVCALTATALPEGQSYTRLFSALEGLLSAIEAAPSAHGWGASLVRFELLLLAELGFGLDLGSCAASGSTENLIAVSPRSGRAVSAAEAEPYGKKLLPLPAFLSEERQARGWDEILDGLTLSGHFMDRDLLIDRSRIIADARQRLIDRLRRAAGIA